MRNDPGFGTRSVRPPNRDVRWLTPEDKWRLTNFGLSLMLAFSIAFILGVTFFRSLPWE